MAKRKRSGRRVTKGCGCPGGATKVSTAPKRGTPAYKRGLRKARGPGFVCVAKVRTVGPTGAPRTMPRFVRPSC
jgi:hypothetical protein